MVIGASCAVPCALWGAVWLCSGADGWEDMDFDMNDTNTTATEARCSLVTLVAIQQEA